MTRKEVKRRHKSDLGRDEATTSQGDHEPDRAAQNPPRSVAEAEAKTMQTDWWPD